MQNPMIHHSCFSILAFVKLSSTTWELHPGEDPGDRQASPGQAPPSVRNRSVPASDGSRFTGDGGVAGAVGKEESGSPDHGDSWMVSKLAAPGSG